MRPYKGGNKKNIKQQQQKWKQHKKIICEQQKKRANDKKTWTKNEKKYKRIAEGIVQMC